MSKPDALAQVPPPPRRTSFSTGRVPDHIKHLMLDGFRIGVKRINEELAKPETPIQTVIEYLEFFNRWVMGDSPQEVAQVPMQPVAGGQPALIPGGNQIAILFNQPSPKDVVTVPAEQPN